MFNLAILRHNRLRPVWITCFGIVYRVLSKHVQGSTSFSIVQFSRSCAGRSRGQLIYFTTSKFFCQELFWSFFWAVSRSGWLAVFVTAFLFYFTEDLLSRPFRKFSAAFDIRSGKVSCPVLSLLPSGANLRNTSFPLCLGACLARQPDYNTTGSALCQHLFSIFFGIF